MVSCCIYCGRLTTDAMRACVPLGALQKDYGHDYSDDPRLIALVEAERLAAKEYE